MRSMHISALVLAGVLGLTGPGLLRADTGPTTQPATRPHGEHGQLGPIMTALKATTPAITEDEKDKIKPIMEAAKAKFEAFRAAHQDEFQQLRKDMAAAKDAGDKDKMASLRTKMEELMKDAPKPKEIVDQILPILTADQQTSFKAALETYRKEHFGPGAHRPKAGAPAQQ
jgi:hypothetical protein